MYACLSMEVFPELIPPGASILVAVSGGPDSVALAQLLWRYGRENPWLKIQLTISHINHKLRKEADQEAELVANLADQWGIPLISHEFQAKIQARNSGKSLQESAREWRYGCWWEDMKKQGCTHLATAHHLGDQAETLLYRLLRGSGTAGLAGIYPVKDGILRPLLGVSKEEILRYCKQESLPYATDVTNLIPVYQRNKIRLELIPYLEKDFNERIQEALGRTAELLRWDEEYIQSQLDSHLARYIRQDEEGQLTVDRQAWKEPKAILSRLLRKAAALTTGETRGLEYKFIKIMMVEGERVGWQQDLPGFWVEASQKGLRFFNLEKQGRKSREVGTSLLGETFSIPLEREKWHSLPSLQLEVGLFSRIPDLGGKQILWQTELNNQALACLREDLVCRNRRIGDRVYFKRVGHKSLKKVFQEHRIAAPERGSVPLLAYEDHVLWIPGVCRSDEYLPDVAEGDKIFCFIASTKPQAMP